MMTSAQQSVLLLLQLSHLLRQQPCMEMHVEHVLSMAALAPPLPSPQHLRESQMMLASL